MSSLISFVVAINELFPEEPAERFEGVAALVLVVVFVVVVVTAVVALTPGGAFLCPSPNVDRFLCCQRI